MLMLAYLEVCCILQLVLVLLPTVLCAVQRLYSVMQGTVLKIFPRRGDTLHQWDEIWRGGMQAKFQPHQCSDGASKN